MTIYNMPMLVRLTYAAGWRGGDIATGASIAMAESHGNPDAIGDTRLESTTWGASIGLWQIRSLRHEYGTGGVRDERANFNPVTNARHAHEIWSYGRTFEPWTAFTSGSYTRYLTEASAAAAGLIDGFVLTRYLLNRKPMLYGADVSECQRIVGCKRDGWYGPITRNHVETWQSDKKITVDGIVGPETCATFGWYWAG
jgi:peptidoglycan hydrolase-like protein with peptidoglycan-binding domain